MASALRKLLLAGLVAGVSLSVAEGVARAVPEPAPAVTPLGTLLTPHPTRLWAMAPGRGRSAGAEVDIDADGLRVPARQGSGPLIVTTGDSSIFGHSVRAGEALHDQLAQRVGGAQARTVATPGYSTLQTTVVMQEVGWALRPDLLVIGNLWSDNNFDAFRDAELLAHARSLPARLERAASHLALFRHLRREINRAAGRPTERRVTWPTESSAGMRRVPIGDYVTALCGLLEEARERNVGVVFLALTNRERVAGQFVPTWRPYFSAQALVASSYGAPLVDGTAAFVASGLSVDRLFVDQMHPSTDGHRVLAEAVATTLRAEGWPSQRLVPGQGPCPAPPVDPFAAGQEREPNSLQSWMRDAGR